MIDRPLLDVSHNTSELRKKKNGVEIDKNLDDHDSETTAGLSAEET